MSFYNKLLQFLEQAKTENLKTSHLKMDFLGTRVKFSFGQGVPARIPWISFLKEPNTTSSGIYPVYLYYKNHELLILAYGISETNMPSSQWNIQNNQTINEFFEANFFEKPARYGSSYIFKVYRTDNLPSEQEINNDLEEIIMHYIANQNKKEKYDKEESIEIEEEIINNEHLRLSSFDLNAFKESISISGLQYSKLLITRFIASLLTKPFVILTGLSGSGKTKLAQAFAQWICESEQQYRIVPVGADWTNREPLLGYPNALDPNDYVKPDSGVLDLIIQANEKYPELPHFLILDEMNLSQIERYFADFLSVMESKEEILLHGRGKTINGVTEKLSVPSNMFIIGTVNIDETTNMFSPKVLDRANTIEFRVAEKEMVHFLSNRKEINMPSLNAKGKGMAKGFMELASVSSIDNMDNGNIHSILINFFGELKITGAEFGYRSAAEILRLIRMLTILDNNLGTNEKIDIAIMQKLLPKLHGSRRKLCPVLEVIGSFCVSDNIKIISDVFESERFNFNDPKVRYPISLEKIARMYKGAIDNGFASFAEA